MRHDFDSIPDGSTITLYPNDGNPLHKKPVKAFYQGGYFYCEGSPHEEGPDYYFGDVHEFNEGFEVG